MGGSAHLNFTAGGAIILGGVAGYARAGSVMSLAGGGTIGGALVAAGVVISKGKDLEGHALALAASSLLLAAMGARFAKTGKFMPAGAAAGVGALTALKGDETRNLSPEILPRNVTVIGHIFKNSNPEMCL